MDVDCLFPPDSVTWRVHADGAMLIGGIRALLLQPLHPEAMAGFAVHSRFREESWNRLYRTAEYIGTVTYGSVAEAERAVARVRMVHSKLGLDRPDLLLKRARRDEDARERERKDDKNPDKIRVRYRMSQDFYVLIHG
jgi:hypothetical protein